MGRLKKTMIISFNLVNNSPEIWTGLERRWNIIGYHTLCTKLGASSLTGTGLGWSKVSSVLKYKSY
jgi:hypothetical protein